jgi:class 3 adenylate cyclase
MATAPEPTLLERLGDPAATLASLLGIWKERDKQPDCWTQSPDPLRLLGARLLRLGAPFNALDVATEGLKYWPDDVLLRQTQAQGWIRSGAPEPAQRILTQLYEEGKRDEETIGLLARTHKDLGLRSENEVERSRQVGVARNLYAEAYRLTGGYWTGINVATLATLLKDQPTATETAQAVRTQCLQELKAATPGSDRYWLLATLGEAALNVRDFDGAIRWYTEAVAAGQGRYGDLSSTRRQARLLAKHLGLDPAWSDKLFHIPRVVMFVGHMIDQPGRPEPRFPQELTGAVADAIGEKLEALDGRAGFASAACGSDILFHQTLGSLKGESHVVLPYESGQFVVDSVDIIPNADWPVRFAGVLRQATQVTTASGQRVGWGGTFYDYANLIAHGLAAVRARDLETDLVALAVWDGRPGDGPGGTASVVQRWQAQGLDVQIIDPAPLRKHAVALRIQSPAPSAAMQPNVVQQAASGSPDIPPTVVQTDADTDIMALLFADAVGYSKLSEAEVLRFGEHFLGSIGKRLEKYQSSVVERQTRGDGLYLVFKSVRDAGAFALDLCDLVTQTRWEDHALPSDLTMRIALHAGPVVRYRDPITGQLSHTGTHVTRAARIEPITPPGQVYASQGFAALAAVEKITEFTCDFVKQAEWHKNYGTFPTYVVRRRSGR